MNRTWTLIVKLCKMCLMFMLCSVLIMPVTRVM